MKILMNTRKAWNIWDQVVRRAGILEPLLLTLIGAYRTVNHEIVPIEVLAEEVATHSRAATEKVIAAAKAKGVTEGNSLYYYGNAVFHEDTPGKLYNDLTFIGSFEDPRRKYF